MTEDEGETTLPSKWGFQKSISISMSFILTEGLITSCRRVMISENSDWSVISFGNGCPWVFFFRNHGLDIKCEKEILMDKCKYVKVNLFLFNVDTILLFEYQAQLSKKAFVGRCHFLQEFDVGQCVSVNNPLRKASTWCLCLSFARTYSGGSEELFWLR